MNGSAPDLAIDRDAAAHRYTATLGGELVGLIDYSEQPGSVVFLHTETIPAFQGRGFAGRLTTYALDDVRKRGLTVVPLCSYTQRFLTENPQYADLVAESGRF
jgi:uncharacterized protein